MIKNNSNKDELNIQFKFSKDKLKTQVLIVIGLIAISFFSMSSYVTTVCWILLGVDVVVAIFTSFSVNSCDGEVKETMEVSADEPKEDKKEKPKKRSRKIDHSNEPNPTASVIQAPEQIVTEEPKPAPVPAPAPEPPVQEEVKTQEEDDDDSSVNDWADFFGSIGDDE